MYRQDMESRHVSYAQEPKDIKRDLAAKKAGAWKGHLRAPKRPDDAKEPESCCSTWSQRMHPYLQARRAFPPQATHSERVPWVS